MTEQTNLGVCPSDCDDDCDVACHEGHHVPWKRQHDPEACPGTPAPRDAELEALRDRYAAAINQASPDTMCDEDAREVADALLAVRDAELDRLRAQVAAARAFAAEMREYCTPHGISAMYADRLDAALDKAGEAGRG